MNARRFVLRILLFSFSTLCFLLTANNFYDIKERIRDGAYTQALTEMEKVKLSRITKKRLLAQLAKQWQCLSSKNRKRFDELLLDLLPADQVVIENLRERYHELAEKELAEGETKTVAPRECVAAEDEEEVVIRPTVVAPTKARPVTPVVKKQTTPVQKKMKSEQQPAPKAAKKMSTRKKPTTKKMSASQQAPVTPAPTVRPIEINVREEL